ncbi:MAG: nitrous oxide reductase family maturation protein NosD [Bacteroidia bacterium]|nr:nitrous oxide reductase family maturation protein NosD [Bacteroidia bacterium]
MASRELLWNGKKYSVFSNKLASILPFFLLLFSLQILYAKTIHVGPNHTIKKIKQAIAISVDGDTILIVKGIYKEGNIVIRKKLNIIGIDNPILDGEKLSEIFTISANNFLVKGITFKNSGYSSMEDFGSIKIIDATNFKLENNTIINASFAIHISNCSDFSIKNNIITGSPREEQNTGNGIHLWKSSKANISGNKVSGHRDGIYLEFVSDSELKDNLSSNNIRYGLHFMFSNNDTYTHNTFTDNGAGVAVMFSQHVYMYSNTFENNLGASAYGILLKEISDGEISKNVFKNNTIGILMEGTSRLKVKNNRFEKNGWGFRIQASCSDITVVENNFTGNTFDIATNGTLVLNKFDNNYWDKYEGYDLNKDGKGDVPFHPVSMFAMITEEMPYSIILYRSFMVMLLERAEKAMPSITPIDLKDNSPLMKAIVL